MRSLSASGETARESHMVFPPQKIEGMQFLVHELTQVVSGTVVGGYTVIVSPKDFWSNPCPNPASWSSDR